jgi:hypothetical protein
MVPTYCDHVPAKLETLDKSDQLLTVIGVPFRAPCSGVIVADTFAKSPDGAAFTVNASDVFADPYAFVAVNVIDPLAVAVGVPDKTPALLNAIPVGSVPAVTLQVIGAVPVAVNVVVG